MKRLLVKIKAIFQVMLCTMLQVYQGLCLLSMYGETTDKHTDICTSRKLQESVHLFCAVESC